MNMTDPGLGFPKGTPRVLDRIEQKRALAKQERECRAAVKQRDGGRCRVPGCRDRATELHHIQFRSQLGRWVTSNICPLCQTHHRFVHAGLLDIRGNADRVLVFTEKA